VHGLGVGLLTTCTAVAPVQQYILMTFLAPNSIQVYPQPSLKLCWKFSKPMAYRYFRPTLRHDP